MSEKTCTDRNCRAHGKMLRRIDRRADLAFLVGAAYGRDQMKAELEKNDGA